MHGQWIRNGSAIICQPHSLINYADGSCGEFLFPLSSFPPQLPIVSLFVCCANMANHLTRRGTSVSKLTLGFCSLCLCPSDGDSVIVEEDDLQVHFNWKER